MKIALLCPTRERPKDVERLINSIEDTTFNLDNNVVLVLGVDDNDPTRKDVENLAKKNKEFVRIVVIPTSPDGKFLGLGKIWNIMYDQVDEEIIGMVGDDMVFQTENWNKMILEEFKKVRDNILMVHVNDGMRGMGNPFPNDPPLAVNSFIHRRYCETFGKYCITDFLHGFHDTHFHDVYELANRKVYRHDIMLNHLHVSNPVANTKVDDVTDRLNQAYISISNPQQVYDNLLPVRKAEAEKLKSLMIGKGKPLLSILICTLFDRVVLFNRLLTKLREQESDDIEIHYEIDNGDMSVGKKRNKLLDKSRGQYIAFVDDDDMISDNYIELVLNSIEKSYPDVVGMHLLMTVDGQNEERTYHSIKYDHWWDEPDPDRTGKKRYFRNPNHLNPVKRVHAIEARFPDINVGEDREYSQKLLQHLKTEEYIEQPIYFYLYRSLK